MMPNIVAGSRPVTAALAQKRRSNSDTSIELHRLPHLNSTETGHAHLSFSWAVSLNTIGVHRPPTRSSQIAIEPAAPPHLPRPAISSLGGFRTPAPSRGVRGTVRLGPASENLHKGGSVGCFDPNRSRAPTAIASRHQFAARRRTRSAPKMGRWSSGISPNVVVTLERAGPPYSVICHSANPPSSNATCLKGPRSYATKSRRSLPSIINSVSAHTNASTRSGE
jgi:hypothetical protein